MFTPNEMVLFAEFIKRYTKGQVESYGENQITMNMKDVNKMVWNYEGTEKVSWENYLKEILNGKASIVCYGDGNWVTIQLG